MDFQKYGLTPEAQARIDSEFLNAVLGRVASMGQLVWGTRDELEAVYIRTHTTMHEAVVAGEEVANLTLENLGKLSFVDTLRLASSRRIEHKGQRDDPDVLPLAEGRFGEGYFFRLFRRLLPEPE